MIPTAQQQPRLAGAVPAENDQTDDDQDQAGNRQLAGDQAGDEWHARARRMPV